MTLKIQYVSDLHLEFLDTNKVTKLIKNTGADVLILAGDIAPVANDEDYEKILIFLKFYAPKFKYILHVAGNHEMYVNKKNIKDITKMHTIDAINRKLKAITKIIPNYIYLNCDAVTLNINGKAYGFIGATLWTKVDIENRSTIESLMNDYQSIYVLKNAQPTLFKIEDMQKLHARHTAFIKKAVAHVKTQNVECILITHHKPVWEETKLSNHLQQAYESDITNLISSPIKIVIFGHCHKHFNKTINSVKYLSNCKGYPSERTGFINDLVEQL